MTIKILRNTASMGGLVDIGVPARPLSEPPCRLQCMEVPLVGTGGNETGIWECAPGKFQRTLASAEVMHILAGRASFTPDGGDTQDFGAGDSLFFPENTFGVWHIHETIRKLYVIFGG